MPECLHGCVCLYERVERESERDLGFTVSLEQIISLVSANPQTYGPLARPGSQARPVCVCACMCVCVCERATVWQPDSLTVLITPLVLLQLFRPVVQPRNIDICPQTPKGGYAEDERCFTVSFRTARKMSSKPYLEDSPSVNIHLLLSIKLLKLPEATKTFHTPDLSMALLRTGAFSGIQLKRNCQFGVTRLQICLLSHQTLDQLPPSHRHMHIISCLLPLDSISHILRNSNCPSYNMSAIL